MSGIYITGIIQNLVSSCIFELMKKELNKQLEYSKLEKEIIDFIDKDENSGIHNISSNYKDYYRLSISLYSQKRYKLCADLIKKAIHRSEYGLGAKPNRFKKNKIYLLGINVAIINNDKELAKEYLGKLKFKLSSKFAIQHYETALLSSLLKDYNLSLEQIGKALKYDKKQVVYLNLLSLLYLLTHDYDEALTIQTRSLDQARFQYENIYDIGYLAIFNNLILIHTSMQNFDSAIEYAMSSEMVIEKKFHKVYKKNYWNTYKLLSELFTELISHPKYEFYSKKLIKINEQIVRIKKMDNNISLPLSEMSSINYVSVVYDIKKKNAVGPYNYVNLFFAKKDELINLLFYISNDTEDLLFNFEILLPFHDNAKLITENIDITYSLHHDGQSKGWAVIVSGMIDYFIDNNKIYIKNVPPQCTINIPMLTFKVTTDKEHSYLSNHKICYEKENIIEKTISKEDPLLIPICYNFNKLSIFPDYWAESVVKNHKNSIYFFKMNIDLNTSTEIVFNWHTYTPGRYTISINNIIVKEYISINAYYNEKKIDNNIITDEMIKYDHDIFNSVGVLTTMKDLSALKLGKNTISVTFTDLKGNVKLISGDCFTFLSELHPVNDLKISIERLPSDKINIDVKWNLHKMSKNVSSHTFFILPVEVEFKEEDFKKDLKYRGLCTIHADAANEWQGYELFLDSQNNKFVKEKPYIGYIMTGDIMGERVLTQSEKLLI